MANNVTINGVNVNNRIRNGRISVNLSHIDRGTVTFTLDDTGAVPVNGHSCEVTLNSTKVFSGTIQTMERLLETRQGTVTRFWECTAVDLRGIMAGKSVLGSYKGKKLKAAIQDVINDYLSGTGISLDGSVPEGPFVTDNFYEYVDAEAVINAMITTAGYRWDIGADNKIWYGTYRTAHTEQIDNLSDLMTRGKVTIRTERGGYANNIVVKGASRQIAVLVDSFNGDGTATTFTLRTPPVDAPKITLDGANQTVEVTPQDTSTMTADWGYDVVDGVITQNPKGTVLTSTNKLEVHYDIRATLIGTAQDDAEITARSVIEPGDGRHTFIEENKEIVTEADAVKRAEGLLALKKEIPETIQFTTPHVGFLPLQQLPVNVNDIAVQTYIVETVTIEVNYTDIVCHVTGNRGAEQTTLAAEWKAIKLQANRTQTTLPFLAILKDITGEDTIPALGTDAVSFVQPEPFVFFQELANPAADDDHWRPKSTLYAIDATKDEGTVYGTAESTSTWHEVDSAVMLGSTMYLVVTKLYQNFYTEYYLYRWVPFNVGVFTNLGRVIGPLTFASVYEGQDTPCPICGSGNYIYVANSANWYGGVGTPNYKYEGEVFRIDVTQSTFTRDVLPLTGRDQNTRSSYKDGHLGLAVYGGYLYSFGWQDIRKYQLSQGLTGSWTTVTASGYGYHAVTHFLGGGIARARGFVDTGSRYYIHDPWPSGRIRKIDYFDMSTDSFVTDYMRIDLTNTNVGSYIQLIGHDGNYLYFRGTIYTSSPIEGWRSNVYIVSADVLPGTKTPVLPFRKIYTSRFLHRRVNFVDASAYNSGVTAFAYFNKTI